MKKATFIIFFMCVGLFIIACGRKQEQSQEKAPSQEEVWDYRPMVYIQDKLYGDNGKGTNELPEDAKLLGTIETQVSQTEAMVEENFTANTDLVGSEVYGCEADKETVYVKWPKGKSKYGIYITMEPKPSEETPTPEEQEITSSVGYDFEKSIFGETRDEMFEEWNANIGESKTIEADSEMVDLLKEFSETKAETSMTREMPDLAPFYDTSNEIRVENCYINEIYIYEDAMVQSKPLLSYETKFELKSAKELEPDVYLVEYREWMDKDYGEEDKQGQGSDVQAYLIKTTDGYRIIKSWPNSKTFEALQEVIAKEMTAEEIRTGSTKFQDKILENVHNK